MSYGYEEFIEITPEQVLQKVSQQEIFAWLLQQPFDFKLRYKSPFREHSKGVGTCRFEQREDGTIIFVDFGDSKTHRTCFGMVMDIYRCPLIDALKIVLSHFNLSKDKYDYKEIQKQTEYIKTDQSSDTIITFDPTPIEKRHKLYISQFLILPQHLEEDLVYPTNKFYIQKPNYTRKSINVYAVCFAFDFIDKVKIYQPYSLTHKFITNCDEDNIGNFDNIDEYEDELVICKSWKDHRVVRNILFLKNVIWLQNEGMIPSAYILENLSKRFKLITIFFDNDDTGVKAAMKLQLEFNKIKLASCRIVFIPKEINYKDAGETVKAEGRQDTIKILKQIGLCTQK